MLYWEIAFSFFVMTLAASIISMILSEDYGPNPVEGILQRIGLSFVAGCAWPLCIIFLVVVGIYNLCVKIGIVPE